MLFTWDMCNNRIGKSCFCFLPGKLLQGHSEFNGAGIRAVCPDGAAVCLRNPVGNRKTDAKTTELLGPGLVHPIEGIKEFGGLRDIHFRAGVESAEQNVFLSLSKVSPMRPLSFEYFTASSIRMSKTDSGGLILFSWKTSFILARLIPRKYQHLTEWTAPQVPGHK